MSPRLPRTVATRDRRLLLDGDPTVVFCGEVHYFRIPRRLWRTRLQELKDAGATAVATYIPWLVHELPDGTIDVTGASQTGDAEDGLGARRDVGAFCDLAAELGLLVVARPGPFQMAELKNEGIPHRIYGLDGVRVRTWGGRLAPTRDLDYLAPAFLAEVRRWYDAILPVLANRLVTRGGPVVAVQLDNEVGMLAWVSNSPCLTEAAAVEFRDWLVGTDRLRHYPALLAADDPALVAYLQSPPAADGLRVTDDLCRWSRVRFARYLQTLAGYARERGIEDVPLLVNIHGTGGGRGRTYPIGISQLLGSWRGDAALVPGSDMYLGDLTTANVADLVVGNVFAAATQGPHQPLTALEFEAGDGDYGEDLADLVPPEATTLRTHLAYALGNRLLNFYLFAGGSNPALARDPARPDGDGLDRIAFTGEQHGFAAPIGPSGVPNSSLAATADVIAELSALAPAAARMTPHRDLTLGFVSEHYLTEYAAPGADGVERRRRDLERFRGMGSRDILARALVLNGFGLDAVDLCAHPELDRPVGTEALPLELSMDEHPVLAVASAHYLSAEVQRRLADYVVAGGRLLLTGVLPTMDGLGEPCTVLAQALGLTIEREYGDARIDPLVDPEERLEYYATVSLQPRWRGAEVPDVRVGHAQTVSGDTVRVLGREVASGAACVAQVAAGSGRAVLVLCDYPCDLEVWASWLALLELTPFWRFDADRPGAVCAAMADPETGAEQLHLLNVAPYAVTGALLRDGAPVEHLVLAPRSAVVRRFAGPSDPVG